MKEYPKREDTELLALCECGHMYFDHELDRNTLGYSECEKCMCPKFNKEKEITQTEYANLRIEQIFKSIKIPKENSV